MIGIRYLVLVFGLVVLGTSQVLAQQKAGWAAACAVHGAE
jgi:hypothetical protein